MSEKVNKIPQKLLILSLITHGLLAGEITLTDQNTTDAVFMFYH